MYTYTHISINIYIQYLFIIWVLWLVAWKVVPEEASHAFCSAYQWPGASRVETALWQAAAICACTAFFAHHAPKLHRDGCHLYRSSGRVWNGWGLDVGVNGVKCSWHVYAFCVSKNWLKQHTPVGNAHVGSTSRYVLRCVRMKSLASLGLGALCSSVPLKQS